MLTGTKAIEVLGGRGRGGNGPVRCSCRINPGGRGCVRRWIAKGASACSRRGMGDRCGRGREPRGSRGAFGVANGGEARLHVERRKAEAPSDGSDGERARYRERTPITLRVWWLASRRE
jgi:hypothetical protein